MHFLVLAILSSFCIGILIKLNESRGVITLVVLAGNYLSASALAWAFACGYGVGSISPSTLALGLGGGVLWPTTFFMIMWGIRRYGLSITGSVSRLSLTVPVLIALIFLGEVLTPAIGAGLPAAFVAFVLISPLRRGDMRRVDRRALWFFPLLVLLLGTSEFWVNLFNKVGVAEEKFVFMTLIFSFSCVPAWAAVVARKQRVDKSAFLRGMLLGVPNFFSMFFFLESLKSPVFLNLSIIVYTVYSVSVMTLAFGAGALFWKERVTRANVIGILFAIATIILLNI